MAGYSGLIEGHEPLARILLLVLFIQKQFKDLLFFPDAGISAESDLPLHSYCLVLQTKM